MPWPKTGASHYHQLGHPDNGCAIKGLVVCDSRDVSESMLAPLNLLNGLAQSCYQPFPKE